MPRPYICFIVKIVGQYMAKPRSVHSIGEKHVLRYIVRSMYYGLDYIRGYGIGFIIYTDSD
jgi:hypothetical protein